MSNILRKIVNMALSEDIGTGDLSSSLLADNVTSAKIICREKAIICGIDYSDLCFLILDPDIEIDWKIKEGEEATSGTVICHLKGKSQAIISAERTALNFLQTLSATATQTKHLVSMIKHTNAKLLDTRKTIPNLRHAQKHAVKCGGGENHRMGLFDCILLKENHIFSIGSLEKSIEKALFEFPNKPLIVEVESLDQLKKVLLIKGVTRILCDNFSPQDLLEAVAIAKGIYPLETSGNINEKNIIEYAETGVDYISIGSITKNIHSIDLSLKFDLN
jgi:nicotinate-nucleotide pyrophosphorylase (carboxylating)